MFFSISEPTLQATLNVEEIQIENIKNNTAEKWEEVVQIFRENKRKREKEERKFRKKNQFRFGSLVQLWTVDILTLN